MSDGGHGEISQEALRELIETVANFDEDVVANSAEVSMLRHEAAEAKAKYDDARRFALAAEERQLSIMRWLRPMGIAVILGLAVIGLIGYGNRQIGSLIIDCTMRPASRCGQAGRAQQDKAVAAIADQNGNGIGDNLEILALHGGPPATAPPTTTTLPPTRVQAQATLPGWLVTLLCLASLAALAVAGVYFWPLYQRRRRRHQEAARAEAAP